jgi:hypothetical protein
VARITSNDDTSRKISAKFLQPRHDTLRRTTNCVPIHPRRSRHLGTTQPRGTESQRGTKSTAQFLFITSFEQAFEVASIGVVGVARYPGANFCN